MLKKLFRINLFYSLLIVFILSFPLILWVIINGFDFQSAKLIGRIAIFYFGLAFLLYMFLYSISHLPKSELRKKIVLFTRVYIRFHIAIAFIGTLLIVDHVIVMESIMPITPNTITGYLALFSLISVLFTGYLRKRKSSGKRRLSHRYMAFVFIGCVIIHIII